MVDVAGGPCRAQNVKKYFNASFFPSAHFFAWFLLLWLVNKDTISAGANLLTNKEREREGQKSRQKLWQTDSKRQKDGRKA